MEERTTLAKAKKKVDEVEVVDVIDLSAQESAATNSRARSGGRNEDCEVVLTTEKTIESPPNHRWRGPYSVCTTSGRSRGV